MLLKQWEHYKASPAQKNKRAYNQQLPEELKSQDKWKGGPYNRTWGRGRGKKNEIKTPNLPKPKFGKKKAATPAGGKGKGRGKTPQSNAKGKPGSATIIDINPINLDADYVTYVLFRESENE